MKRVLLIIVDALASRVLLPAMEEGRLPNFQALAEAGWLAPESVAIFPSITPAATSSLVTGRYPQTHDILGYHWYDFETDEVVYYGDDFWVIWEQGFDDFFRDFLYRLNHQRLEAKTIYQKVEAEKLKAASLNYLIYHGDVMHKATVPLVISLIPGVSPEQKVYGPSILYFGDLVDTEVEAIGDTLDGTGGLFHRFGFDDNNTANLLLQLLEEQAMPDFTLAYFPDNDYRSHEVGPEAAAADSLEKVDQYLGRLFNAFGGLESFLEDFCLILTGDHSQTDMLDDEEAAGISLEDLLTDFTIADVGTSWGPNDDLVICPDMRTVQIYFREFEAARLERAVEQLLADDRIDQVIWRSDVFSKGDKGYYVATRDRDRLHFWPGTDGPNTAEDQYGCTWSWDGPLEAVDGRLSEENKLTFPDYPNAFERIVGGLNCKDSGHLWATARPGHEFRLFGTGLHTGGGSHGSLQALDSISPLFVAGAPEGITLPDQPRAVDVTPLCLTILGIEPEFPVGASRIEADGSGSGG